MSTLALMMALALSAAPKQARTEIKIEVKPQAAVIYLDGKKVGTGDKPHAVNVKPGTHAIRVVYKGDEHTEELSIKKDQVLTWQWSFEDAAGASKIPVEDKAGKSAGEPTPEK